jgi:hypothetical protein
MNRVEYNGWTNYETWAVHLWMDNEESSQKYWHSISKNCDTAWELAEKLKDEHLDTIADAGLVGFMADLIHAAFSEVNWLEIAQPIWDDTHAQGPESQGEYDAAHPDNANAMDMVNLLFRTK